MRIKKFRGRRKDNGEWVYGNLIDHEKPFIVGRMVESNDEYCNLDWWCPVQPETVGEFTGLHDKNGKEIWEGDIIKGIDYNVVEEDRIAKVIWASGRFVDHYWHENLLRHSKICEVLGNIYQHHELLEERR